MKTILKLSLPALCGFLISGGHKLEAQNFQNLNFEGAWSNGSIPDWTVQPYDYEEPNAPLTSYVSYGGDVIDTDAIELNYAYSTGTGRNQTIAYASGFPTIDGNQSLFLEAGNASIYTPVSISQVGTIPQGTESMTFLALNPWGGTTQAPGPLNISFAGNELVLVPLSNPLSGGVIEYSANVSAYAGETGSLSIGVYGSPNNAYVPNEGWAEIDDIAFTDVATPAIPEAKSFTLVAAAMCLTAVLFPRRLVRPGKA